MSFVCSGLLFSWSRAGDKLLSGSDDTKLNIYHPFENYKLSHSISTG